MQTEVIRIYDVRAQSKVLKRAGEILRSGGLVAFPTETVYGLGANGFDGEACKGIYLAKGRPSDNPLILHVANRAMIGEIAAEITPLAEKLLAAFCPGPITLILKRKDIVPDEITGGLDTVGIRMPENDVARAMIKVAGVPVAAPSANLSGRPSPTTAEAVLNDLEGRVPLILDGGPCEFGVESTIVDCTGETAVILRPGAITEEMLEEVAGRVMIDPALVGKDAIPKAPGMKYKHYAPKAPLTLVEGAPEKVAGAMEKELLARRKQGEIVGVLASEEVLEELGSLLPDDLGYCYGAQGDLPAIAASLYEGLRYFDDTEAESLLAEGTTSEGLGLAIMNRLRKASGFNSLKAR